jgi:hypothetical protein
MIKRMQGFLWILTIVAFLFLVNSDVLARENNPTGKTSTTLAKPGVDKVTQSMINIGNWGYWYVNDGMTAHSPYTGDAGGFYPRGTAGAIYREGLVWGGIVDDPDGSKPKLRVGGNTYNVGTQPGWIVTPGDGTNPPVAVAANDDRARIYRIRSDWATLTASAVLTDAAEIFNVSPDAVTSSMTDDIIESYKNDWKNWPTDLGAPYYDVNGNGSYDPVLDENGMPDPSQGDYPGLANADQVLWFVVNDMNPSKTTQLYGSPPIGLEVQITAWAYNQPTAGLGQIVFTKFKIFNKSGYRIDDMYFAQWSDPDLGNYGDDLTGCDTTLSMMFAYNGFPVDGQYQEFGLAPAAVGYDFFQGPIVESPGDEAVFGLKRISGYKNLPMTAYGYFGSGTEWTDPDLQVYDGTLQWYNLLRGFAPTVDIDNPTEWVYTTGPNEGQTTKFPLSGDPITGSGDVDGVKYQPGDRRMLQCTGPITFNPGEQQEVVVGTVGGLGANNIQSVADMKSTDDVAQIVYDNLFQVVPKPPEAPQVQAIPLDDKIVLNWGWNADAVKRTEEPVIINYEFEGYNVYQLSAPTSRLNDPSTVRIATFDKDNGVRTITSSFFSAQYGTVVELPIQFGTDTGLQRFITIERDFITNRPLYRGTTYYFAVTAYNYDPDLVRDRALESPATVFAVTPQDPKPGVRYDASAGDLIEVTHDGPSDGQVLVRVIDPAALTGHSYEVTFVEDDDGHVLFNLKNTVTGEFVLTNQKQVETLTDNEQLIADGLQVQVSGPNFSINAIYEADQDGNVLDPRVAIAIPGYAGASLGTTGYLVSNRAGVVNSYGSFARDFDRFDYWRMDDLEINFGEESVTWDYINETVHASKTPFSMYRHKFSTGERIRLFAGYWDYNGTGAWELDGDNWVGPIYGAPSYEPIYAWQGYDADGNEISYDPANEAQYIADNDLYTSAWTTFGSSTGEFVYPWVTATLFTMYLDGATPPWGNKVIFQTNKPNSTQDKFTFTAPGVTISEDLAKEDVEKINVFPNPYYGNNALETSRFFHFVTFNHLPQKASFRIFNLGGSQVRMLEKDDNSQFLRWDLLNENGLPVASGLYIVYIDMPDLGKTKVLKLAVVQPKQILEFF